MPTLRVLLRLTITCVAINAWSGCADAQKPSEVSDTTASGSSAGTSQVLITFKRDTSAERIQKVTRELGVSIDQTMFDRIVVGSASNGRTMADLQTAAKKYPEVVAVEPSSKVRPQ
jgi:hypothetical protein